MPTVTEMKVLTADQLDKRPSTIVRSFAERAKLVRQRTRLEDEPKWVSSYLGPRYNNLIRP